MWKVILFTLFEVIYGQVNHLTNPGRFRLKSLSSAIVSKAVIGKITTRTSSPIECAGLCALSKSCSRFVAEEKECILLQDWPFLIGVSENDSVVTVHELIKEEWTHLMVMGGFIDDLGATSKVEVLNMKTMKQCPNPPQLPDGRYGGVSFQMSGTLNYAFGRSNLQNFSDTLQFDSNLRTWHEHDLLTSIPVYPAIAQICDSWILLIGGEDSSSTTIVHSDGSVIPGPELPFQMIRHCAIGVDEEHIFIAGGTRNGMVTSKKAFVLKWADQVWVSQDSMAKSQPSVTCETFLDKDGRLSILVGQVSFEIFVWSTRTWRSGPEMLNDYVWSQLIRFDGVPYLFGGRGADSQIRTRNIYAFNPIEEQWAKLINLNLKIGRTSFGLTRIPPGIVEC